MPNAFEGRLELIAIGMLGGLTASVFAWGMPSNVGVSGLTHELDNIAPVAVVSVLAAETDFAYPLKFIAADNSSIHEDEFPALGYVESLLLSNRLSEGDLDFLSTTGADNAGPSRILARFIGWNYRNIFFGTYPVSTLHGDDIGMSSAGICYPINRPRRSIHSDAPNCYLVDPKLGTL